MMTEYTIQTQKYEGSEPCEHHELKLTDPTATKDDIQLLPDAFLTDLGPCPRTATMIVRIDDNYADDTYFYCDEHAQQQIDAFRRDFG